MYDQCGLFWSPLIAKCQDPEIRIMFRCCSVYIVTVRNDFPRGINKMLVLRMYIRCILYLFENIFSCIGFFCENVQYIE